MELGELGGVDAKSSVPSERDRFAAHAIGMFATGIQELYGSYKKLLALQHVIHCGMN